MGSLFLFCDNISEACQLQGSNSGAFFFFLDVFECFFEHANGRLYVAIFQMKIRVNLVDISPDRWIVHAINLGRFDEGVVDRIQNHVATGSRASAVAAVYNKAQKLPERAAALDAWARMVTQDTSNVVTLRQA